MRRRGLSEKLGGSATAGPILVIEIAERLSVGVADDEGHPRRAGSGARRGWDRGEHGSSRELAGHVASTSGPGLTKARRRRHAPKKHTDDNSKANSYSCWDRGLDR